MQPLVRSTKPRTKVLVVRPAGGVRSVRPADQPDRTGIRLAIGVIVALGVVGLVWLMGYLGFRLGFAALIDVPDLQLAPADGLGIGAVMLVSVPRLVVLAGLAEPTWLMIAFALILVPAAGLAAARPRVPGGPRPSQLSVTFASTGAIVAALYTTVVIAWTASMARNGRIEQLRIDPLAAGSWMADLSAVAGMDALAVVGSALWVVLVMRLPVPTWLRALAATASFFTLVVATVAMSISNACYAQLQQARSEVFLDDGSVTPRLLLGTTSTHTATMRIDQGVAVIELLDDPGPMTVVGRQSIVSMMQTEAARARGERR